MSICSLMLSLCLVCLPQLEEPVPLGSDLADTIARAVVFQRGAALQVPTGSLHGRFFVAVRKPDGSGFLEADVERSYDREPERMVTRRVDTLAKTDTTVGWDGQVGWFRDNRGGMVRNYSADPESFVDDLADLRWQMRIMRLVHDAVSLGALLERLQSPAYAGREALNPPVRRSLGSMTEADVLTGRIVDQIFDAAPGAPPPLPGDPEPELAARLAFAVETGALQSVSLETLDRVPTQRVELWFVNHGSNAQGLQVPQTIMVLQDGLETLRLGIEPDAAGRAGFSLGLPLDDALFAAPPVVEESGEG